MRSMAIEHLSVNSGGNVKGAAYDLDTQTLYVEYQGGSYQYHPVNEEQALELSRASSATQFIRQVIAATAIGTRIS